MDRARRKPKPPAEKFAMQSPGDYRWCSDRLKAVADPDRLRIVNHLLRGSKNVTELAGELDLPVVNVSHHLQVLRRVGVLEARKQGKFVIYSVHPEFAGQANGRDSKLIDLGCCRLEIVQPALKMARPTK